MKEFDESNEVDASDDLNETIERANKKGHSTIIGVDCAKWNVDYVKKQKVNLAKNQKLVDELREFGICYEPDSFKRTYGFVQGKQMSVGCSNENYDKEDEALYGHSSRSSEDEI